MNRLDRFEQRIAALEAAQAAEEQRRHEEGVAFAKAAMDSFAVWESNTRPEPEDGPVTARTKGILREALPVGFAAERLGVDHEQIDEPVDLPGEVEEREPHRHRVPKLILERLQRREDGARRQLLCSVQRLAERILPHERVGDDPLRPLAERLGWLLLALIVWHARTIFDRKRAVKHQSTQEAPAARFPESAADAS